MRLRIFFILIGGLLVVATYTYPMWQPHLSEIELIAPSDAFPGLAADLQESFVRLPPDQQRAYNDLASEGAEEQLKAVQMVTAALQPGIPAPEADLELPPLNSPQQAAVAAFTRLDPIRWAQGRATVYLAADERKILRFENFTALNGGDLRVILSANRLPATTEEMRQQGIDFDAGVLRGTYGTQNYELPVELDLRQYASIVLYSPSLDMIYSVATLVFLI